MKLKPVPIPPEETSFKKGIPMSVQLRKEKLELEKTAISRRATAAEVGAPRVKRSAKFEAFSIKFQHELGDKVREYAEKNNLTASELVRRAVKEYINKIGGAE